MDDNTLLSFQHAINYQGYAFQYKVADFIQSTLSPQFDVVATEYPIEINGNNSKVDIIFTHRYRWQPNGIVCYVGECKRVNPAYSNWLFVKSPKFNTYENNFLFERYFNNAENGQYYSGYFLENNYLGSYNLAFEVKTKEKGDAYGTNRDAIENAATQVIRGTNGFIKVIDENIDVLKMPSFTFCPVIFTTAKLFTA